MEASKTATEIDSRVTCQRGGRSVICAYKQNLLTGRDPREFPATSELTHQVCPSTR
jgi:hypothetical protein